MRKLKLQVQMTVDGYMGGPNSEMDWVTFNWDDALNAYVTALTEPLDWLVLCRKLVEGFISYLARVAANPKVNASINASKPSIAAAMAPTGASFSGRWTRRYLPRR